MRCGIYLFDFNKLDEKYIMNLYIGFVFVNFLLFFNFIVFGLFFDIYIIIYYYCFKNIYIYI